MCAFFAASAGRLVPSSCSALPLLKQANSSFFCYFFLFVKPPAGWVRKNLSIPHFHIHLRIVCPLDSVVGEMTVFPLGSSLVAPPLHPISLYNIRHRRRTCATSMRAGTVVRPLKPRKVGTPYAIIHCYLDIER